MRSIIISSNASGGGKTTVTLGILKFLKDRGYNVQGYKVGPDYIDSAFHSHVTGVKSRNLDLFLMGEKGIKASFSRNQTEIGIIEGVMGLYDGTGITSENSTAHIAEVLDLPVVLVLSPKAQVATLCAEINGLINFRNIKIAGVILNDIGEGYFKLLKLAIERNCNIKVFGYLPSNKDLSLKSRHLGLIQSCEINELDDKIELCAKLLERHVDMELLLKSFGSAKRYQDDFHVKNIGIKTAVAYDSAFNFYYRENLELFKESGEVIFFSPLKDKKLPEDVDFLYIGGGYPEVFAKELSENTDMLKCIKNALDRGLKCYAECGALMYLTEAIEGENMVGFFNGKTFMTNELMNFGYAELEVNCQNSVLSEGSKINCHEFHTSYANLKENCVYTLRKPLLDGTIKEWNCGYLKGKTLVSYAHTHFFGNINMYNDLVDTGGNHEQKI